MNIEGKKIFMLVNYDKGDKSIGITKKIDGEIKTFRNMGAEVFFSAYEAQGIAIYHNDEKIAFYPSKIKNLAVRAKLKRFELLKAVNQYLSETKEVFDVGYLRNLGFDSLFLKSLRCMKKKNMKVVLEMLSWTPNTKMFGRGIGWFYIAFSIYLNGKKAGKLIDLILEEANEPEMLGCKAIPFGNGIDVDACQCHHYEGNPDELNLISVANEDIYHGYDRLIKSLAAFEKKHPSFKTKIYLVGVMSQETKQMVQDLSLTDQVILTGKKYGKELDDLYRLCNIAVGPLGQHRVGGKKDTGLKTKEYFARGIPYIYSGEESIVPDDYPYLMRVPSDETEIPFEDVFSFWKEVRKHAEACEDMREFARQHYSWEKIMKRVFSEID